ncbi:MAG: hypothetical protein AAFP89_08660 [Bacteroidota bacterium]
MQTSTITASLTLCMGICLLLFLPSSSFAQIETDVFLIPLSYEGGQMKLGEAKNITNRKGYDNQPSFSPDGSSVLYVAADDSGQSDIFYYDIQQGGTSQLTETPLRKEYSPKVTPDGQHVTAVAIEKDEVTQRIWKYGLKSGEALLMEEVDSVGYYDWIDADHLGYFVLTDPFTLQVTNVKKQEPQIIAANIGSAIHTQPGTDTLTFIRKDEEGRAFICAYHRSLDEVKVLAETLGGSEDFCWSARGTLLLGDGQALYELNPYTGEEWKKVSDLTVGRFYRPKVSPDGNYLAIVVYQ